MGSIWIEAARPRTLSAAVAPVLAGTAASHRFIAWRFFAALIAAVAIQIGVNYANDYFDGTRGIDTPQRQGPRRAVAGGLVTPAQMRLAMTASFLVATISGLTLVVAVGPELLIVGVASILAALAYSGGPRPYASAGLGEISVFIFFGLVATVGSAYVQVERISNDAVAAAVPIGFLATALLVVNNLRDIETDRVAGKHTLAVRMGRRRTRTLFVALLCGAFAMLPVIAVITTSLWPIALVLLLPLLRDPISLAYRDKKSELVEALVATARLHLIFGILLASALWVS